MKSRFNGYFPDTPFYFVVILVVYFFVLNSNQADYDLWHRLASGAVFVQNGWVLPQDIFAYTPVKQLWIDHEWGAGVIFYILTLFFGDTGLMLFKFISMIGIFIIILALHKKTGTHRFINQLPYYLLACLIILPGFVTTVRSQAVTYVFFTLWILWLEGLRNRTKHFWLLPVTMIFWANIHGGFLAGIGLLFMYGAGELLNGRKSYRFFLLGALCALVTLLNPYGITYWKYILEAVAMERPFILEWGTYQVWGARPDQIAFIILFVVMVASFAHRKFVSNKQIDWVRLIVVGTTLILAIRHGRHLVFWGISTIIFCFEDFIDLQNTLSEKFDKHITRFNLENVKKKVSRMMVIAVYFLTISFLLIQTVGVPLRMTVPAHKYPVKAIEFMRLNDLSGRVMVPFRWGAYTLWKLYPHSRVSIDSRYETAYPNELYIDMMNFYRAPQKLLDFSAIIKKYPPDIILTLPGTENHRRLKALDDWRQVYEYKYAAVFLPSTDPRRSWLIPHENFTDMTTKYCQSLSAKISKRQCPY